MCCLFWLTLLMCGSAIAQGNRYTIKGRVTEGVGSGIPGVTVVLRGSSQGTTTVADGPHTFGTTVASGRQVGKLAEPTETCSTAQSTRPTSPTTSTTSPGATQPEIFRPLNLPA